MQVLWTTSMARRCWMMCLAWSISIGDIAAFQCEWKGMKRLWVGLRISCADIKRFRLIKRRFPRLNLWNRARLRAVYRHCEALGNVHRHFFSVYWATREHWRALWLTDVRIIGIFDNMMSLHLLAANSRETNVCDIGVRKMMMKYEGGYFSACGSEQKRTSVADYGLHAPWLPNSSHFVWRGRRFHDSARWSVRQKWPQTCPLPR